MLLSFVAIALIVSLGIVKIRGPALTRMTIAKWPYRMIAPPAGNSILAHKIETKANP